MKGNLKKEKGITLIALVITIIVLLILAIVTIRIVVNQNIINHANNAVTAYNEAQNNEAEQLTWVEGLMQNKGGTSTSNSESSNSGQSSVEDLTVLNNNELSEILNKNAIIALSPYVYCIASCSELSASYETHWNATNGPTVLAMPKEEGSAEIGAVIITVHNPYPETEGKDINIYGYYNNQWYFTDDDDDMSNGNFMSKPYNGQCPVTKSFSNIICESYLDKVIASFNN